MSIFRFCNVQFFCSVPISPSTLDHAVISMMKEKENITMNAMRLNSNFQRGTEYNFTVCLAQPLFGNVSTRWFVEWVEANALFGADKILVHNFNISSSLKPYIDYYRKIGLMNALSWSFPPGLKGQMHCHLQQTMISDCQYRLEGWSR